mgnify:CR=1 FL=1
MSNLPRSIWPVVMACVPLACEAGVPETPRVAALTSGPTATAAAKATASSPAAPQLPTVLWMRGPESGPLAPDFASRPRDPMAAKRSADGMLEGRVLISTDDTPAAELIDLRLSTDATKLVVRGADRVGFAGPLFWAHGGLGAVVHDTATNTTRTVPMANPPVSSPDGAHLAFQAASAVFLLKTSQPQDEKQIYRGDLGSQTTSLQFAGDGAVIVPANPAMLVPIDGRTPITLPPDVTMAEASHRGKLVATISATEAGNVVSLVAASDGRVIGRRALGHGNLPQLAWSPDEAHLVAAAAPQNIWLIRAADGASTNVAQLEDAMLLSALAVTSNLEICVWTRSMTRTSCEGWAVYSIRDRKALKDDDRVCLRSREATALVSVDRSRYLPLMGDGTGLANCHWVLSHDGTRHAGIVSVPGGAIHALIVDVATRKVVHSERIDATGAVDLAFLSPARLEITSTSPPGQETRRWVELPAAPARKP